MLKRILYPNHIEHSLLQVKELQTKFPTLIIGGSVALYLHGIMLQRFNNWSGDFDFINGEGIDLNLDKSGELPSNCDFQVQGTYNERKVDLRIDSELSFDVITYRGFLYKVALLEDILKAKCGYKRDKDKQDLREMLKLI